MENPHHEQERRDLRRGTAEPEDENVRPIDGMDDDRPPETPAADGHRESLASRLDREEPDPALAPGAEFNEDVPTDTAARLVNPGGSSTDRDGTEVADEVLDDYEDLSPEEAAIHVVDELPGATDHEDDDYVSDRPPAP